MEIETDGFITMIFCYYCGDIGSGKGSGGFNMKFSLNPQHVRTNKCWAGIVEKEKKKHLSCSALMNLKVPFVI